MPFQNGIDLMRQTTALVKLLEQDKHLRTGIGTSGERLIHGRLQPFLVEFTNQERTKRLLEIGHVSRSVPSGEIDDNDGDVVIALAFERRVDQSAAGFGR